VSPLCGAIHLAHACGPIQLAEGHVLDRKAERFKARKITGKKSFRLAVLPDCFQLLPPAGRGNVHEIHGTRRLLEILAASDDEAAAEERIGKLEDWLMASGPRAWESISEAYLILKEGFVPTGLLVGRTLPLFDLVGRDRRTGARILAQCKKDPSAQPIDADFLEAWGHRPRIERAQAAMRRES